MDNKILRRYLFKEVEMVQGIIGRMATYSFLIKGWAITLIVASLIIRGSTYHHYVSLLPWFLFWVFDAYFLRTERVYRKLYGWLVTNRLKSEEYLLDMDKSSLEVRFGKDLPSMRRVMYSKTLVTFYGALLVIVVVSLYVDSQLAPLGLSSV